MKGENVKKRFQMINFRDALHDCRLMNLGCVNGSFTFSNRSKGSHEIRV